MVCGSLSVHYTIVVGFCLEIVEFLGSSKFFSAKKIGYQLVNFVPDVMNEKVMDVKVGESYHWEF